MQKILQGRVAAPTEPSRPGEERQLHDVICLSLPSDISLSQVQAALILAIPFLVGHVLSTVPLTQPRPQAVGHVNREILREEKENIQRQGFVGHHRPKY